MLSKILDVPVGIKYHRDLSYNEGDKKPVTFGEFIGFEQNKDWFVNKWPDSIKHTRDFLRENLKERQEKLYVEERTGTYDLIAELCEIHKIQNSLKIIRDNYSEFMDD